MVAMVGGSGRPDGVRPPAVAAIPVGVFAFAVRGGRFAFIEGTKGNQRNGRTR